MEQENIKISQDAADQIAVKVVDLMGSNHPVKVVRKSKILSALAGATGFALFIKGIEGMFSHVPDVVLLLLGLILMSLTGLLITNLNR